MKSTWIDRLEAERKMLKQSEPQCGCGLMKSFEGYDRYGKRIWECRRCNPPKQEMEAPPMKNTHGSGLPRQHCPDCGQKEARQTKHLGLRCYNPECPSTACGNPLPYPRVLSVITIEARRNMGQASKRSWDRRMASSFGVDHA